MNSYFALTKTFLSAISMSQPQDKRRKIMIIILSIFAVFGVLLPVSIGVGLLVNLMTQTLQQYQCEALGIQLMFHIICIFTVIFGINVVFNELYFSSDLDFLLPLPLRASQIVGSKFTAVYYNENIMQFVLVLSCIIGFGTGSNMKIGNWILSLIGIITLPILPLSYCGILALLLMGFTPIIKNKDIIQRATILLLFSIIIGLVASIGSLQNMDIDHYVSTLASGNQSFFKIMNIVFPNVPLYTKTIHEGSILALLAYILVSILPVGIMLLLSKYLYFQGVIGLRTNTQKQTNKNTEKMLTLCIQKPIFFSYGMKELKILLRTPVFLTNCVAVNFIWPIFIYAILKLQNYDYSISKLQSLYAQKDMRLELLFSLGIIGISILVGALSSLSSNAISREGKHFSFMKYIPVPYFTQWNAKAFIGILLPFIGIHIYFIPICILLKIPCIHILYYVLSSLMALCFISYLGIYIDSIQPKLIWDDELSALRENYNTFFSMSIAIAFATILCVGGFFLFCNTTITIGFVWLLLLLILSACNLLILFLTLRYGVQNIEEQEEA